MGHTTILNAKRSVDDMLSLPDPLQYEETPQTKIIDQYDDKFGSFPTPVPPRGYKFIGSVAMLCAKGDPIIIFWSDRQADLLSRTKSCSSKPLETL